VAEAAAFALPHAQLGEEVAAAVVLRPGARAEERELRDFAAARLAPFKVPRRIVLGEELPKTATGKLQRVGLAERLGLAAPANGAGVTPRGSALVAPRTPTEAALCEIWCELLERDGVGVDDSFFDLGGHSLLAASLMARIERAWGRSLPLETLLTKATIADLAQVVVSDLVGQGAKAVVLTGSHTRGDANPLSDVDIYAIGAGPAYTLRVVRGHLVAISWRTEEEERRALHQPASAGAVVPAWRGARILHDPDGVAEDLRREAERFDWSTISVDCDKWVADATVGYAEEVLKLVAARRGNDRLLAAVQRSIMALRLPRVMAVHHRLLYETENRLWHLVAQRMGDEWAAAQAAALGLEPGEDADRAALRLFALAADEVRPLLTPSQAEVADLALHGGGRGTGRAALREA
jgi:predicted nucleotidyltransferase